MIDAYYSLGSDSTSLFENTKISQNCDYKKYMNKFNVIHLDISTFWDSYKDNIVKKIIEYVYRDFEQVFGDELNYQDNFSYMLMRIYQKTNIPFVIIIDEWDCAIRNGNDEELVHKYLQFLHSIFKSEESKSFLALAYVTGILPIKKIKDEVKVLCRKYDMDFETVKAWYNGYLIDGKHMYNPNSVVIAMDRHRFDSYWKNASSFETINTFISMNYEGLKDEALTALIHLGYLGYDRNEESAYVPNYEVKMAYQAALNVGSWREVAKSIAKCDELLRATINGNSEKMAE